MRKLSKISVLIFSVVLAFTTMTSGLKIEVTAATQDDAKSITEATVSDNAEPDTIALPGYDKMIEAARNAVQTQLNFGVASASVAVRIEGKLIYSESFGLRDRVNELRVARDTQFNIGSVSKLFTAAAMLVLVQEGKVNLDKPVTTYLPDFTMKDDRYKKITVRMLLNHSAGFPGTNFKDSMTTKKDRNYIKETLDNLKNSILKHDPGEISLYCNDGFTVAEAVIEKVSGTSFSKFIMTNILLKLGLNHTSACYKIGNQNIARYYEGTSKTAYPVEYVNTLGSGGLSSTAEDLTRFAEILYSDDVLNADMRAEFMKAQYGAKTVPVGEPLSNNGLGWGSVSVREYQSKGVTVLTKDGATTEYVAQLDVVPTKKISVATTFAGVSDVDQVNKAILNVLLDVKESNGNTSSDTVEKAAKLPDTYKSYEGIYASGNNIVKFEIDPNRNGMLFSAFNGTNYEAVYLLEYRDDGYFYTPSGEIYSFVEDSAGKYVMLHSSDLKYDKVVYEKLKPLKKINTSVFEGKLWVPLNLKISDLFVPMIQTGQVPEIEGYCYSTFGGYKAVALKSTKKGENNCRYARDEVSFQLAKYHGNTALSLQRYYYGDASKIASLSSKETITIGDDELNEARLINKTAHLKFTVPKNGRVVVYTKDLQFFYDSLIYGNREITVEKGYYLIVIGEKGAKIKITASSK